MILGAPCFIHGFASPALLKRPNGNTRLYAESGPPQYQKRGAVLRETEILGDGSVLLHIDQAEGDEETLDYQPGHVLALEIQGNPDDDGIDEKTAKDIINNDGWMRGPYTITRCNGKSFDILIKVVGPKSKALASAQPGTSLRFGGKFKVPIADGIAPNTERIVMLSTGVGVGPCVGAVEKLLSNGFTGSIDLFASFRHQSEKLLVDYLNIWSTEHDNFQYRPVITSEMGRLSASEENVQYVITNDICPLTETHYHLIGNGQMVTEWKMGLEKAGVPQERVTIENYFNHKAEPSEESIDRIASVCRAAARSPLTVN